MTVFLIFTVCFLVLILVYGLVIRPWHLRWGATDREVKMVLPGDHLVTDPNFNATRGITIAAPPAEIWKWIIQLGSGRAGWYSLDWIDNGGKQSADEIVPAFQTIKEVSLSPLPLIKRTACG